MKAITNFNIQTDIFKGEDVIDAICILGAKTTNSVEGFFALFKRTIFGTYHQISPKHLHRYCTESSYRFNSRKIKDADRFRMALSSTEGRLKYKDLIQKT